MSKKTTVPDDSENHLVVFHEKAIRRDKELAKGWGQIATPLCIETETPRTSLMKKSNVQYLHIANTARMLWDFRPLPSEQQSLPYRQQLRDQ